MKGQNVSAVSERRPGPPSSEVRAAGVVVVVVVAAKSLGEAEATTATRCAMPAEKDSSWRRASSRLAERAAGTRSGRVLSLTGHRGARLQPREEDEDDPPRTSAWPRAADEVSACMVCVVRLG
jgi:hypothetical protein